jgi:hypothetical protein
MSFCINCGKGLAPDDMFCQSCGKPVVKEETNQDVFQTPKQSEQQAYQPPPQSVQKAYQPTPQPPPQQQYQQQHYQQPAKKKSKLPVILIILFIILALGGVGSYFAYKYITNKTSEAVEKLNTKLEKEITKEIPKEIPKEVPKENPKEELKKEDGNNLVEKKEEPVTKTKSGKTDCGYYPYLSTRKISADELDGTPFEDLRLMRNEIFMRHGLIFKSEDLKKYFSQFPCYNPKYDDVTSMLTEIEKYNINIIKGNEKR